MKIRSLALVGILVGTPAPDQVQGGALADEALHQAYLACERHIQSPCAFMATCNAVCVYRTGALPCSGVYEWPECDKIAEQWLADPLRVQLIEEQNARLKAVDEADHDLVRGAAKN